MAELLLFHHALGLTRGCLSFAGALRDAGHILLDYDASAATLLEQRVLSFLENVK